MLHVLRYARNIMLHVSRYARNIMLHVLRYARNIMLHVLRYARNSTWSLTWYWNVVRYLACSAHILFLLDSQFTLYDQSLLTRSER